MIYRVDVYPRNEGLDPIGEGIRKQLAQAGHDVGAVATRRIFLIDADASREEIQAATHKLLADPIAERAEVVSTPAQQGSLVEVHLKPGVMDPVAGSTETALRDLGVKAKQVRTGRAFRFGKSLDRPTLESIAKRYLANAVVEHVFFEPQLPDAFLEAHSAKFEIRRVPIRDLTDQQLTKLSRDGHLFLNLAEMKAVQAHYQKVGREPTDVELETLAQTWSEHCVHKTLKSAVEVVDESGKVVRTYKNLIKETIFASTMELMSKYGTIQGPPHDRQVVETFCLSVFKDNAGVIAFDETHAVCFKVETHNRPSAIEPYGGAATGIGGCIRDVLGTGLGARPIANTNVFCVAYPDRSGEWGVGSGEKDPARLSTPHSPLPTGVIHPKRILQQVVAGVRDYGNRMGIPTVNGAVHFDDNYIGNPLVFAGCVGIIPRGAIDKRVNSGDAIVLMGGRTGRDGIHGATFSSAELTSTHADEFSHAVQIGNAITQKKLMDVLLLARDRRLYTAVTDCGAGGLSSAIGEMGGDVGATVELDTVPLKYAGLRYDEIWISEAQERMVLSVPQENVAELLRLSADEDVETTVIGTFGTPERELVLRFHGTEVGRMSMELLHDGIPMPTRRAQLGGTGYQPVRSKDGLVAHATEERLLKLLAHPNIASKHWIIRQYDHEVQGGTIIKPLVGPRQIGPSDAAVIMPKLGSPDVVIIACGLASGIEDPYAMALASIDEAIRNAVCVGARLETLAILDNFCWPGVHDEISLGTLVRACEACRDGALGYRVPFISGKDSLHNQFTDAATGKVTRIPNTLLISAIGVKRGFDADESGHRSPPNLATSDLKRAGNTLWRIVPAVLPQQPGPESIAINRSVHEFVSYLSDHGGIVEACHDISDGGVLVAAAEMCIGSNGLGVDLRAGPPVPGFPPDVWIDGHREFAQWADRADLTGAGWFGEHAAGYLLEMRERPNIRWDEVLRQRPGIRYERIGTVTASGRLRVTEADGTQSVDVAVDDLTRAWRGTLDW